jgi:high frequency lysogenization protein
MSKLQIRNQAIALAGLFQAVKLVQQVAGGQSRDTAAIMACLTGVFNTDPAAADSVFGELPGLHLGLQTLLEQLGPERASRDMDITRHAITLLYLERKLSRNRDMLDRVRAGIDRAREQMAHFDMTHGAVIGGLAECYRQTVSTLQPRVMISGEPVILENPDNQNLIRALLLAAIRAAVLWRQCGGRRLSLFLRRRALLEAASGLLEASRSTP